MLGLSLRMLWRDWRAGELGLLLAALMVAVASLCSVNFFTDRMRAGLARDANQLLAADLLLSADQEPASSWRQEAERQGLQTAQTVVFPTMALSGSDSTLRSRLISLKAVSQAYPLRGRLNLQNTPPDQPRAQLHAHQAWLDPVLMDALQLQPGGSLQLGDAQFTVAGIIDNEPDRGSGFASFAPRVMIRLDDLAATHLVQDGSRATYRLLVAGRAEMITALQNSWQQRIDQQSLKGLRLESLENGRPEMHAALQRAQQFLSLVSLLSAMLAAVAIAMSARRFMLRHINACAMLRCLGMTQNQVSLLFLLEFVLIGLLASAAGVLLGFAGHFALLKWLGQLVGTELPPAGWTPAWQGMATGLLLLIGFALPPVLQLRGVPHNHVVRREQSGPKALTMLTYGMGLLMFGGLLMWQTSDAKIALLVCGGFIAAAALFGLLGWGILRGLKAFAPSWLPLSWRFALNALLRRPAVSVMQIVSLALGLMALLLLTVVRGDLIHAWQQATPADAPNQFIINIQPDQITAIEARLQEFDRPRLYPMIRGRLIEVNQQAISAAQFKEDQAKRLIEREFNLSAMDQLPPQNTIVAGKWLGEHQNAAAEASVEEGIAKSLRLKLGDELSFDVAGQTVKARITSLRKLDWGSMRVNFFVILNPAAVSDLPASWITAFHLPKQRNNWVNQLLRDFPNLTVIDVGAMIEQVQHLLDQVIAAVEFLFVFTLASGLLVLYAALASSQELRTHEAALLRALGASALQLKQVQRLEFVLIGSIAGLFAAAGASSIGWALARFSFDFAWSFGSLVWLAGISAGVLCASIGGWLALRHILRQPPLISLRGQ